MKLEYNKTGIKLDLEECTEKILLTYTSEQHPAKKVTIIIQPALNKQQPKLLLYVDSGEYRMFQNKDNEDLFCVLESGLVGNWEEVTLTEYPGGVSKRKYEGDGEIWPNKEWNKS